MTARSEETRASDVRVARWDALQPADGRWTNLVGKSGDRDEFIARLRRLADFLEARPEIPVPPLYASIALNVFAEGTDAEKLAQVDYASTLLEVPVADDTPDGGHYLTGISFGNLEYRFVAIPAEPVQRPPTAFETGQEVRIAPEVARAFRRSGIAQAGVIISCDLDGQGQSQYLVRVPGRIKMHLPGKMLEPVTLAPVTTSRGQVSTVADAETSLIDAMARIKVREARGELPDRNDLADHGTLSYALARICGLPRDVLIPQLDAQAGTKTEQRLRAGRAAYAARAARVAARDVCPDGTMTDPAGNTPAPAVSRVTPAQPAPRRAAGGDRR
jgi:hypothetical protein